MADVRASLDGGNAEEIRAKIADLTKATMKIGEAMAKEGQQAQQGSSSTEGSEEKKE